MVNTRLKVFINNEQSVSTYLFCGVADSKRRGGLGSLICSVLNLFSRSTSSKPRSIYQDEYDKIKQEEGMALCKKGINRILTIAVENFTPGIPMLGAALDMSFGLYRVFLPEANRILLRRMVKLGKLVKKQRELDKDTLAQDDTKLCTFEIKDESDRARAELDEQIEKEIYEFCTIFSTQAL